MTAPTASEHEPVVLLEQVTVRYGRQGRVA